MDPVPVDGQWVISSIDDGAPARLAGVQRGWILTHWNGNPYSIDTDTTCELGHDTRLRFVDLQGRERNLDVACAV